MQLNSDVILATAKDILKEYGLADLTMRRLARALEVTPGTLYWHFPSKQDLLGAIAGDLLAAVPSPSPSISDATASSSATNGRQSAGDFCAALYTALTSLRDGAEITLAALASGTTGRDVLAELQFLSPDKGAILYHYVFGAALDLQARQAVASALGEPALPKAECEAVSGGVALILGAPNS